MKKLTAALIICFFVLSGMAITVNAVNLGSYTGTVGTQYSKKMEKTVSASIDGTRLYVSTSNYNQVGFYQKAVLGNGVTQVSPAGYVDVNTNNWCGFWSGYSTVPNNALMAYMKSKSNLFNDTITYCNWWY